MKIDIAVLPGDGVGPEIIRQSIKILEAIAERFDHDFVYKEAPVGGKAIELMGSPLPDTTLELCRKSDAILFGAIGEPRFDHNPEAKVRPEQGLLKLRKELDLFANIRPVKIYEQIAEQSPLKFERISGTDIVIFRELTGGIYFGDKELSSDGQTASDSCSYSVAEIERIAHLAFRAAQKRRKKLTLVDKANVLETSRLWRKTVKTMADQYEDVALDFLFVDNAAMQLILRPSQFDVILTENMFGDILSDEASIIGGSIGLLPSASIGTRSALFEPIHGSYPEATGKGIANPIASVLSVALLLEHFNLTAEAEVVKNAVHASLQTGVCTKDIAQNANSFSTESVGDFLEMVILDGDRNLNDENIRIGQATII